MGARFLPAEICYHLLMGIEDGYHRSPQIRFDPVRAREAANLLEEIDDDFDMSTPRFWIRKVPKIPPFDVECARRCAELLDDTI